MRAGIKLAHRTLLVLCGVAVLSTLIALVLQDRVLSRDLESAAWKRLMGASEAAGQLVRNHVGATNERYRAISGTPQFRATLEIDDAPTLSYYAQALSKREGAALIAFVDPARNVIASSGLDALLPASLASGESGLVAHEGEAFVASVIPLRTSARLIGSLVAVESIPDEVVDQWSTLCGARVEFAPVGAGHEGRIARRVERLDGLELRVSASLAEERQALWHARINLLVAGGIAIAIAFLVSTRVSRSLVEPILEIKESTDRIGAGYFDAPLRSERSDEIGDVARSVDDMLCRILEYRAQVDDQHGALQETIGQLQESREELANAQRMAHIGSFLFDPVKGLVTGSEEFAAIFELPGLDRPFTPQEVLERVHRDDRAPLRQAVSTCLREGIPLHSDIRLRLPNGRERVIHLQAKPRDGEPGARPRLEATVQDVTERKRSEQQIRYLAYHDSLTGLGNRLHCHERIEIQVAQAKRSEKPLGILYLDLDRFKRINDTLGHAVGDDLLKGVADRLVASVRESDYIGRSEEGNAVSRLGGDEFTVVISDLIDLQDLGKVAHRILRSLEEPFQLGVHEVFVSCSIGIAVHPFDGEDVDSLLTNADAAMYHAKESGRNNYQFYDQSMNEVALRRLILENKMRAGLERDEFELFYQPKVHAATERTRGSEALIRWREPESGLVGPDVFIPIAEETGLINPLGEWVIRRACRQVADWQARGIALPVSVNLSSHQFKMGRLAERIIESVEEASIPAELIELEITESTLLHDEASVVAELEQLRSAGFKISLDDFGTGFSSLAYLRRLPVDVLKIDRCFVTGIVTNSDDAALTASIVSMGKALGLRVIAEGVESKEQRDLLAEWGCDEIQGYYYGPPMPTADFEERLKVERSRRAGEA